MKIITVVLFIVIFLASCREKLEVLRVSQEFQDFTSFKKGSWWAYDTIGGIDTLKVIEQYPLREGFDHMNNRYEESFGYTVKWGLDTLKFGSLLLNNGSNGTIETLRYHVRRGNEVYGNHSILARYETTGWNDLENQFYHLVNLEKLDLFNNGFLSFDKTIKSIPNFDEVYFLSPDSVEYLFKELHFSKGIGISRFITRNNKVYSLIDYEIK